MSECAQCGVTTGDLPYEEIGLDIEAADELLFERVDGQDYCQGCAGEVVVNDIIEQADLDAPQHESGTSENVIRKTWGTA